MRDGGIEAVARVQFNGKSSDGYASRNNLRKGLHQEAPNGSGVYKQIQNFKYLLLQN